MRNFNMQAAGYAMGSILFGREFGQIRNMRSMDALADDALDPVSGGVTAVNTGDPNGAHWQPANVAMGTTFVQNGFLWYRIKQGDCLSVIAQNFGTTTAHLKANNPATIRNISQIYAGDAIIIRRA